MLEYETLSGFSVFTKLSLANCSLFIIDNTIFEDEFAINFYEFLTSVTLHKT